MAKAYDRARTRDYIPLCDRKLPPAEQTVFRLGWMSVFDYTAIEEQFSKAPDEYRAFPKLTEIVRRTIRGWTNFTFADGKEAPFTLGPDGLATLETVQLISPREIMEIARDADAQEQIAPEEVGK